MQWVKMIDAIKKIETRGMLLRIAALGNVEGERSCPQSCSASFVNFELSLVGCV